MRAAERRDLRQALAANQAGDRARAAEILRGLLRLHQERCDAFDGTTQTVFAFMVIRCERLNEELVPAHICVARQVASEAQGGTKDGWRGQASPYPSCVTASCAQGRRIREQLGVQAAVIRKLAGGWQAMRARSPREQERQRAAAAERKRAGLAEEPPTIDTEPGPVPE